MTTKTKAILCEFGQRFAIPMAKQLTEQHGWEINYWIARSFIRDEVEKHFPETVFHVSGLARRGIPPEGNADFTPVPLDADILARFGASERHVLAQSDRLNLYDCTMSYGERIRLYHNLLGYWLSVVDQIKPDIVVFLSTPHLIYDHVLYDICRDRGIQTVIFDKSSIVGLILHYNEYEVGSPELRAKYRRNLDAYDGGEVSLPAQIEEHISKLRGDYAGAITVGLANALKSSGVDYQTRDKRRVGQALSNLTKRLAVNFDRLVNGNIPNSVGKVPGRALTDRKVTRWEYLRTRYHIRRQKKRLLGAYLEHAEDVDLSRPYIYVTLQHQPEQAANPQGGEFQHQHVMVETLSALIPEGWSLYVKEHVASLLTHSQFERNRTPAFYERMSRLENVRLVSPKMSSFSLIDKAYAVATISGSAGWEAVLRGKPALLFGYSWYRDCRGVFTTHTTAELQAALDQIAAGYEVDISAVRLYLKALGEQCISAFNIPSWGASSGISDEENAAVIAAALVERVQDIKRKQVA